VVNEEKEMGCLDLLLLHGTALGVKEVNHTEK
jgi:hypothetical protein